MLATALNNLGVGPLLAGIVAPLGNGTVGDLGHVVSWVVLGLDLMGMAQAVLGRLK